MSPADRSRSSTHLIIIAFVAFSGVALTWLLWRNAVVSEEFRRDTEFDRQVTARHALIRENLSGYEDSLLALRLLLSYHEKINRSEFADAVQQQLARHPGFLGVQWAPAVPGAERTKWEAMHAAEIPGGIKERLRGGTDGPAANRDLYYPIRFVEPLATNRHVLGSDAAASPLKADIARAQTSRNEKAVV
jgi:CHASE1-domain containing sensor protein